MTSVLSLSLFFLLWTRFEMLVFIIILVNMISMGVEHYNQPPIVDYILEIANMIFASLFTVEALMKILAFRHFYFMVPWNVFDFLLVVSSILGELMVKTTIFKCSYVFSESSSSWTRRACVQKKKERGLGKRETRSF